MNDLELKILLESDDINNIEFPEKFDWKNEIQRVCDLKLVLEDLLEQDLYLDDGVQDASFFADLMIKEYNKIRKNVVETPLCLRFSSFGNMFTAWSNINFQRIDKKKVDQVISEVQNHGYNYISQESLSKPYTGNITYFKDLSWWHRFFDYL